MTTRKCSLNQLNNSLQRSKILGRSLTAIVGDNEKTTCPSLDLQNDSEDRYISLNSYDRQEIKINILTSNGLILILNVDRETTLKTIKEEVFELAQKQANFGALHDKSTYLFSCVNHETAVQELLEDRSRLCDIRPFFQTMRLIKKEIDKEEKKLDAQIGILIGKGLHEFDALKNPEVNTYRWLAYKFTQNFELIRRNYSKLDYIYYNYPVRLERSPTIPNYLKIRLNSSSNKLTIEFRLSSSKIFRTMVVNCFERIQEVIIKCLKTVGKYDEETMTGNMNSHYVMKVNGREEYLGLLDDYPLIQYTFMQESIANWKTPSFVLKLIDEIMILSTPDDEINVNQSDRCFRERTMSSFLSRAKKKSTPICLIDLEPEIKLKLQLNNAIRVNCADYTLIAIVVGLYHGTKLLCGKRSSNVCQVRDGSVKFDELIEFDIAVRDLPRMSRFSFLLIEIVAQSNKKATAFYMKSNIATLTASSSPANFYSNNGTYTLLSRRKTSLPSMSMPIEALAQSSNNALLVNPLCWMNINSFDYNNQLRTEIITLTMWNYSELDNSRHQTNNAITLDDLLTDINSFDESQWHELEEETLLNPAGTVVSNPDKENATCLTCTFLNYSKDSNASLYYPTMERLVEYYKATHAEDDVDEFLDYCTIPERPSKTNDDFNVKELEDLMQRMISADDLMIDNKSNLTASHANSISMYDLNSPEDNKLLSMRNRETTTKNGYQLLSDSICHSANSLPHSLISTDKTIAYSKTNLNIKGRKASRAYLDQLKEICKRDPLNDLDKQDKELIWYLKEFCKKHIPDSLTHLLASVKWNKFTDQVLDLLVLIDDWPLLPAEKALELLDFEYSDLFVRRFAVKCLQSMTDEELDLYLLQLAQALKFESYMHNDLGEFLLQRSLQNPNIGHRLFWLLRSEMNDPSVSIKFGLLLEAYCRGATNHMRILFKQLDTLNKFKEINEFIRQEAFKRKESREKLKQTLQNILHQSYYREAFQEIISPLNPRQKLNKIKFEKCRFMDSKKMPLWLVFSSEDFGVEDTSIIYKNGDDLRQDMLTIQMLRIFDKLLKDDGLDFRFTFYNVIATHYKVGLIEVVPTADTVANIQKAKAFSSATSAFQRGSLLQWLREQNPDREQQLKAIDEFTKSCAGYCVATYLLGIADRHSDNIMLKSNGQLLHIDFGHILGNFKQKWKIRRERVPFVFTNDFAMIITDGSSKKYENERFQNFLTYCDQAFLVLRRKGTFIIALFAMMLSTGLELSTTKDLAYLRETLVLKLTEQEALKHFRNKFDDSIKNSWKTSFNWFAHNLAKDNN